MITYLDKTVFVVAPDSLLSYGPTVNASVESPERAQQTLAAILDALKSNFFTLKADRATLDALDSVLKMLGRRAFVVVGDTPLMYQGAVGGYKTIDKGFLSERISQARAEETSTPTVAQAIESRDALKERLRRPQGQRPKAPDRMVKQEDFRSRGPADAFKVRQLPKYNLSDLAMGEDERAQDPGEPDITSAGVE